MINYTILQYLSSGFPIIQVSTLEYNRAEQIIEATFNKFNEATTKKGYSYDLLKWTSISGLQDYYTHSNQITSSITVDSIRCLNEIINRTNPCVAILQNFDMTLDTPYPNQQLIDTLILFHNIGETSRKHIIIVGNKTLPKELQSYVGIVELPLPNKDEIVSIIKRTVEGYMRLNKEELNTLSMICSGMDAQEIVNNISIAISKKKDKFYIDKNLLLEEKAKSVKKSGLLEWVKVSDSIDDIGGLDNLKEWFFKIAKAFKNPEEAIKYGLPYMKGTLITGVSGTGKSLCAKVISNLFDVPLFRLDIGRLFDSHVGATERNTRELFKLIDAVSPSVILIDEIEKAMAGLESSGASDSGVTARVIGSFLYYLQEKKTNSFFVCTANNVSLLPPELLRKGRFDELWYVSLPSKEELLQILKIHIRKIGRDIKNFDLPKIVASMANFTGAEVETSIKQALYNAFFEDREVTTDDIINSAKNIIPLAVTRKEEIDMLEKWAVNRARFASKKVASEKPKIVKQFFIPTSKLDN